MKSFLFIHFRSCGLGEKQVDPQLLQGEIFLSTIVLQVLCASSHQNTLVFSVVEQEHPVRELLCDNT